MADFTTQLGQFQNNQINTLEVGANPEQKEDFNKNRTEFKEKYEQKLKKVLPENIFGKISGSFELSGNIDSAIQRLKEDGLSEKHINSIKSFLKENITITEVELDEISKEIREFSEKKNLDIKLGDLIGKAVKKSEETENEDIFNLAQESRKAQKTGTPFDKSSAIARLEAFLQKGSLDNIKIDIKDDTSIENSSNKILNDPEFKVEEELVDDPSSISDESEEGGLLFGNEGIIDEETKKETIEVNENTDFSEVNGEFFPILESLNRDGVLDDTKFQSINKELASLSGEDKTEKFKTFVKETGDSEAKDNILKKFDNPETVTSDNFDKTAFSSDVEGIIDIDKSIGGLESVLAESYIYIPNKERGEDLNKEKSVRTALDVSLAKILNKNSDLFRKNNGELVNKIKSEDSLNIKYNLLKELYKESLLEDAKIGGTKGKKELEQRKDSLKEQYRQNLEEINKIEKNNNNESDNDRLRKLKESQEKIEKEAKNIQDFDKELNSQNEKIQEKSPEIKDTTTEN